MSELGTVCLCALLQLGASSLESSRCSLILNWAPSDAKMLSTTRKRQGQHPGQECSVEQGHQWWKVASGREGEVRKGGSPRILVTMVVPQRCLELSVELWAQKSKCDKLWRSLLGRGVHWYKIDPRPKIKNKPVRSELSRPFWNFVQEQWRSQDSVGTAILFSK